jgi:hypothetical protein
MPAVSTIVAVICKRLSGAQAKGKSESHPLFTFAFRPFTFYFSYGAVSVGMSMLYFLILL